MMAPEEIEVSCIVLAGGESRRMGKDKRLLEIWGERFLERVLACARTLSPDVILSLREEGQRGALGEISGVTIALDEEAFQGPLQGICSALRQCSREYALVLPCDTPLPQVRLFRHLLLLAPTYDAVIPRIDGRIHPLHGVYRVRSMRRACREALSSGVREVREAVRSLEKVLYVPRAELEAHDPHLLSFLNVNTPEDLETLREREAER
jgi:molybdopterin-guanine dinucleotide biosynthesis protein A